MEILPNHYPNATKAEPNITMITMDKRGTAEEVMEEFPSVF